jgi:hypothetical protein
MSLEASVANIVIRNNRFEQGRSSDTGTLTTHKYTAHAWIYGSANINSNVFMSPSTSSDILNIDNCSCTITNNKFIRGSVSINSYVRVYGSNEQIITDNIFDQTTIDGSSENLVLNVPSTSVYERNKNQTKYIAVLPSSGYFKAWIDPRLMDINNNYSSQILTDGASSDVRFLTQTHLVSNSSNPGPQRYVTYYFNLSNFLPKNVKVLEHLIGMKYGSLGANINTTVTSTIFAKMNTTVASQPISASFASPASTLAFINGTTTSGTANLENTVNTNTTITSGNYNTTTVHYNNGNYAANSFINVDSTNIIFSMRYSFSTTVTSGSSSILWSPLLIKYRWV